MYGSYVLFFLGLANTLIANATPLGQDNIILATREATKTVSVGGPEWAGVTPGPTDDITNDPGLEAAQGKWVKVTFPADESTVVHT